MAFQLQGTKFGRRVYPWANTRYKNSAEAFGDGPIILFAGDPAMVSGDMLSKPFFDSVAAADHFEGIQKHRKSIPQVIFPQVPTPSGTKWDGRY